MTRIKNKEKKYESQNAIYIFSMSLMGCGLCGPSEKGTNSITFSEGGTRQTSAAS
jgi:hypothetical protein